MNRLGGRRLRWPFRSVRARLVVALVLVSALGMAAGGAATFLIQRQRMLASVDASLLADIDAARLVVLGASNSTDPGNANGAVPEPFHSGADALQAVIGRVLPNRHQSSLGVLDGRARFVPGVPTDFRLQSVAGLVPRVVREVADGKTHLGTVPSSFGPVRYVATPVSVSGNPDRGIYVAAVDVDAQSGELSSTFATFWGVIAAAMILIGSSAWFIAGRLLNPIRTLRLAAARVTSTNRSERIPIVGHDDLSSLTRTVNLMLDRLDRAMTDQRQLLDDVRHELHTPVTIVRGHLEILNAYDPAEVDATRTLAIEELDRVTELVEDLALLAESQRADPDLVPVDVASLTRHVFAKASILAGHEWALADITDATAALDPARITQAWLQLVDNAAKYSPLGSRIELGSTGHPDDIELWVADQGYGILPEAADRIFARFGRVDTGRGISGSGLGLPIVKAIAESQGGSVGFVSAPGATRFSIVLPYHRETPAPEAVP
ncbi:HAMP domain-containing sensor histidine kinase [Frigoribacterium sp. UYMn621]|uniref:sensor histidine kinase n=1 Tax=Frigoribacterium sp. UYMn621 TaxID=3156343 RepID=UPI003391AECA